MRVTINFTSDYDETVHIQMSETMTLKELREWVHARYSGVAYIAFS